VCPTTIARVVRRRSDGWQSGLRRWGTTQVAAVCPVRRQGVSRGTKRDRSCAVRCRGGALSPPGFTPENKIVAIRKCQKFKGLRHMRSRAGTEPRPYDPLTLFKRNPESAQCRDVEAPARGPGIGTTPSAPHLSHGFDHSARVANVGSVNA
jgi:hypothetical protein